MFYPKFSGSPGPSSPFGSQCSVRVGDIKDIKDNDEDDDDDDVSDSEEDEETHTGNKVSKTVRGKKRVRIY